MLIIFDMGNVVYRSVDILPAFAEKTGISLEYLKDVLQDDFFGLTTGHITTEEFWERFSRELGVNGHEDYLASLFHPEEDPQMISFLRQLRQAGHRVVCGTNTIDSHYKIHMKRGDYGHFDAVYASHCIHLAKPDPAFFQHIIKCEKELDTYSGKELFIDDRAENVHAAQGLGIAAHCYTDHENLSGFFVEQGIHLQA
ncbi:HAD family phosphatase [Marispirochaeta aestuarii]|uniref:HAD family hydrolase n=1 Tax=Marispirochaeta aestuarii TaxID=1963862 RepID=UPI0029C8C8F1|nr:HAD family phosphatase [Marispirochaeta aestuarii]